MIRPDNWIKRMAREHRMIEPFEEGQVRAGISYGVSSYGYDMRISDEFKLFTPDPNGTLDPKQLNEKLFRDVKTGVCAVPPNSFVLARTVEYFRIPRNVITVCFGKSTYARSGILVNVTPFEPEWEGFATVQIFNTTPMHVNVYAHEGIAQILFYESDEPCAISYRDKKGKYQAQAQITLAKI